MDGRHTQLGGYMTAQCMAWTWDGFYSSSGHQATLVELVQPFSCAAAVRSTAAAPDDLAAPDTLGSMQATIYERGPSLGPRPVLVAHAAAEASAVRKVDGTAPCSRHCQPCCAKLR